MATEIPLRILDSGGPGKWFYSKDVLSYSTPVNDMTAEELRLLLEGHKIQGDKGDKVPNRSGSAPPSIEGSFMAFQNLIYHKTRSWNVNSPSLDSALPDGPVHMCRRSLSTHNEEPEDDNSSSNATDNRAPNSTVKPLGQKVDSLAGQDKSFADITQEESAPSTAPFEEVSCVDELVKLHPQLNNEEASNSPLLGGELTEADISKKQTMIEGDKSKNTESSNDKNAPESRHSYMWQNNAYHVTGQHGLPSLSSSVEAPVVQQASVVAPPLYAACMAAGNQIYPSVNSFGVYTPQYNMGGYAFGSEFVPMHVLGYPSQSSFPMHFDEKIINGQSFGDLQQGLMLHPSFLDPFRVHYFQHSVENAFDPSRQYINSYPLPKDQSVPHFFGANLPVQSPSKSETTLNSYHVSPTSLGAVPTSSIGGKNHLGWRNGARFSQEKRGPNGINDPKKHSFLEEIKANNTREINLSDIAGRIVEFSVDQHGSRFIQHKLEICSVEDKASVFGEVLPHASKLMTDVFGNYVIQKFLQYGTLEQRKELLSLISEQILTLSLQMYGCRVIQKALDIVDLDKKTELVHGLDGHVMECVQDQNGNHVIQKCIESIPTEKIGFILLAFQGQVATLSTHPYGCRVIQRVLEHCSNDSRIQCIVDEILESSYVLAQDQYGNYVTQYILQRGGPHERSRIIAKLLGNVVRLSQHKYASNVIEKCLEHGDPAERELLIDEILAQSERNDRLLIMMKDRFANYVVQKILEISNDKRRLILMNRIKVHLQALRKYNYGKHIVARYEQLSGEDSARY